jgi:glutamate synthase (NADPH/NADH) small chain
MGFLKPQLPEVGENVFFAGDVQSGASLVVRAMASGHAAAGSVDAYFNKTTK